jgi:hypothetical protein
MVEDLVDMWIGTSRHCGFARSVPQTPALSDPASSQRTAGFNAVISQRSIRQVVHRVMNRLNLLIQNIAFQRRRHLIRLSHLNRGIAPGFTDLGDVVRAN